MLANALGWATAGYPVFPIFPIRDGRCACGDPDCGRNAGKHPIGMLVKRGFHDATTDAATIRRWWEAWPDANLGLPTGAVSGVIVFDTDGPEGLEALKALNTPATTWLVRTGRDEGGFHQFFGLPPGDGAVISTKVGFRPKLDVKAEGGYVLLPPSLHRSGRRYEWLTPPDRMPLAPLPEDLLALLLVPPSSNGHGPAAGGEKADWAGKLRGAPEGQRHAIACEIAGHYLGQRIRPAEVTEILLGYCRHCTPPFPEAEARTIVKDLAKKDAVRDAVTAEELAKGLPAGDIDNARSLVAAYGEDYRYGKFAGWLRWDGQRWRRDETDTIVLAAHAVAEALLPRLATERDAKTIGRILKSQDAAKIRAMVAQAEPMLPVRADQMDRDPMLVNLVSGTWLAREGLLRPHCREDYLMKLAPVAYDPTAQCPKYQAFLKRVFAGDEALIAFVQRLGGYCLTGDTSERVLIVCYGTGHNGKTTLLETWKGLLGDYALATPIDTLMVKRGDSIPNDVARLAGARLVIATEGEQGQRLAESLVKRLTGGDTLVSRYLFKEWFEFEPQLKILIATNHRPAIRGVDNAIWGRVRLVPFTVEIPEGERLKAYHKTLLREEAPGILSWMLEGLQAWQREGLGQPPAVKEATARYRRDMDRLGSFLADCCEEVPGHVMPAGDLYRVYLAWCEHGHQQPLSQTSFGNDLAERHYPSGSEKSPRTRVGLRLQTAWAEWLAGRTR